MPKVSFCLTNTGNQQLGGVFDIFADPNPSFSSPLLANISGFLLSGSSCPYTFDVPDGTIRIRVRDQLTSCAIDLPISSNEVCLDCNFGFNTVRTDIPARPVVGELTGTCQNPITDYKVYWYGPNDPNNLAFVTGKGLLFPGYDYAHPLTQTTSPLVFAGTYKPVVDKARLNNVNYSQTAATGFVKAKMDCLDPITIRPLTCDSGVNFRVGAWPFSAYTHRITYTANPGALPPKVTRSTFTLSNSTNYFAYRFDAFPVWDELKITYIGVNYSAPIVLENIRLDSQAGSAGVNLLPTTPKKVLNSTVLSRVLTLTGLNRSDTDALLLEVTPNPDNETTSWDFCFTCLTGFTETPCWIDNNQEQIHYKIIRNTVTGLTAGCCDLTPRFFVSGCSNDNFLGVNNPGTLYTFLPPVNRDGATSRNFTFQPFLDRWGCLRDRPGTIGRNESCLPVPSNNNTIIYKKFINPTTNQGVFNMEFSNFNDFMVYYTGWTANYALYSGTPFEPNKIEYFRGLVLIIPDSRGRETQRCGDQWGSNQWTIHMGSQVTTGTTATGFTLNFTMPTISATSVNLWTGGTEDWTNVPSLPGWITGFPISASTGSNLNNFWTVSGSFSATTLNGNNAIELCGSTLSSPFVPPGFSRVSACTQLVTNNQVSDLNIYDRTRLIGTIPYSATSAGTVFCTSFINSGSCRDSRIIIEPTNSGIYKIGPLEWRQTRCTTCVDSINAVVNAINTSSTGNTNYTGTTFRGARMVTPFYLYDRVYTGVTTADTHNSIASISINRYSVATLPMSGDPLTFIPSLSANCLPFSSWSTELPNDASRGVFTYAKSLWAYRVNRPAGSIDEYYDIYALPLTNYLWSGSPSWNFNIATQPYSRFSKVGIYSAGTLTVLRPEYFTP